MKFDFGSDCHIDINREPLNWLDLMNDGSDLLIIAGDHSNMWHQTIESLAQAREIYRHVIYVDGNHDWYSAARRPKPSHYAKFGNRLSTIGVTLLDRRSVKFGDVLFVGANGWYDFRAQAADFSLAYSWWKEQSNDPAYVWKHSGRHPVREAEAHRDSLVRLVADAQDDSTISKIVVITHTAPKPELGGVHGRPPGTDLLDGAYVNVGMQDVLDADTQKKISFWGFGHTHNRLDKTIDGVRFVNNSRGYGQSQERHLGSRWWLVQVDPKEENAGYY